MRFRRTDGFAAWGQPFAGQGARHASKDGNDTTPQAAHLLFVPLVRRRVVRADKKGHAHVTAGVPTQEQSQGRRLDRSAAQLGKDHIGRRIAIGALQVMAWLLGDPEVRFVELAIGHSLDQVRRKFQIP